MRSVHLPFEGKAGDGYAKKTEQTKNHRRTDTELQLMLKLITEDRRRVSDYYFDLIPDEFPKVIRIFTGNFDAKVGNTRRFFLPPSPHSL